MFERNLLIPSAGFCMVLYPRLRAFLKDCLLNELENFPISAETS
jgi:hypothetical protein